LREEAHLTDVIDPLGGSFYVESLTDQMQAKIESIIDLIDAAGGMYSAVGRGLVQQMIGQSALKFQKRIDTGEQTIVGVNAYKVDEDPENYPSLEYPDRLRMQAQVERLAQFKSNRSASSVKNSLDSLARTANTKDGNVFEQVVAAAEAGATHGEICGTLRRELGFGHPLTIV
jgi:methylmalonyl-CoA mutase N-terminal domain/subunit